jgi:DNA-binding response OmpR family regulator
VLCTVAQLTKSSHTRHLLFTYLSYLTYLEAQGRLGQLHGWGGALLDRIAMEAKASLSVVQVGALRIDRIRFEVKIRNREVRLSRKEFELLWVLASEDGRAFRREDLIERVWGNSFFLDIRTVDVHIARLRSKLKDAAGDAPVIETVWGIGYRLRVGIEA